MIDQFEETKVLGVNLLSPLPSLTIRNVKTVEVAMDLFHQAIKLKKLPFPQIINQRASVEGIEIFLSVPLELMENYRDAINSIQENASTFSVSHGAVTISGRGFHQSETAFQGSKILREAKISIESITTTPLSISFLVPVEKSKDAAKALHDALVTKGRLDTK